MGVPDSMNTGIGAAKLKPGEELEWWWSIETDA
jgi:galactose mutarotase-like enzyme